MSQPRLPFIDWMKCLGLLLIVVGHVSAVTDRLVPPIYPKQLGVAFFLFATGYSLARETRPGKVVLFNRLFEIYLFGIACALVVSAVNYARLSDLTESNYLPFLLGANVAFNSFPANPTTWFIGTYIHFLLIWALALRGLRVRPWMLALSLVAEVAARATLAGTAGLFVAYMALTNWMTVFLLGLYHGRGPETAPATGPARPLIGLGALIAAWPALAGPWVAAYSFPFMRLAVGQRPTELVLRSILVSFVYLSYTSLVYQVTRRLRSWAGARFVARNTAFVFIVHMPIFAALRGPLSRWTDGAGSRVAILLVACFLVPVMTSELILRVVRPRRLRDATLRLCFGEGLPGAPRRDPARPGGPDPSPRPTGRDHVGVGPVGTLPEGRAS